VPDIDRGDHRIHWDEHGAGTPLLLIMGATYSSRLWYPAIPALSARHRVLTFDNRGTGGSTATKVASISDMVADALAVLDAAGETSAHVYGVSLGGVVAQQLAIEAPERVRGLVLGCTGMLTSDKPRAPKVLNLLRKLPKSWLVKLSSYGPACPPDRAAADKAVVLADKADPVALAAQQDALRAYTVSREDVARLTMPALVLHGTADKLVRLAWGQELSDTLTDARFITYEGAGHNYLVAAGDKPQDDVLDFLGHVDSTAAVS
jgi:pimeloyl-ACP methyl ester carboxylesterase